jgi:hypothetical protein
MFKVGDKVMLKKSHRYSHGESNPTDKIGEVEEVYDIAGHLPILVRWDKYTTNAYNPSDLYYPHKLSRLLAGVEDAEITE